jgi:membrane protein
MTDAQRKTLTGQLEPVPGSPGHGTVEPGKPGQGTTEPSRQAEREVPGGPTEMSGGSWLAAAKRTLGEFVDDQLTDRAAALTYYAVLSIFPGMLVVASMLGLLGTQTKPLVTNLTQAAPDSVQQILKPLTSNLQNGQAAAGVAAIVGLALALWSASGYIAAFMRAANVVYDVPEGRPFWKTTPLRIGITVLITVLLVASALMVVVSGGLARHVGEVLGIGPTAVTIWNIAKWPVLLIIVSLMISILYWVAPNAKRGFQWVSPGGVIAVVAWLIVSGLFALYLANFAHYGATYGTIAGMIVFLIWLWISNIAILFGAEFNAELERGRAAAGGGVPLGQEPYVELRDTRKLEKRREKAEAASAGNRGLETSGTGRAGP